MIFTFLLPITEVSLGNQNYTRLSNDEGEISYVRSFTTI